MPIAYIVIPILLIAVVLAAVWLDSGSAPTELDALAAGNVLPSGGI